MSRTRTLIGAAAAAAAIITMSACDAGTPSSSSDNPTTVPGASTNWAAYVASVKDLSGVMAVSTPGQIQFAQAVGAADRATGRKNTVDTPFCIASMGKMFTGVAVGQLVEQGKLSWDERIGKYLAGFPAAIADSVTIGQLLTHTSGLGDVGLGSNPESTPDTLGGLLARIRTETLQFTPGSKFSYSNDGFIVAGAIVEKVSGESYGDYVQQHIFDPAGMTHTKYEAYRASDIAGMAHGYSAKGGPGSGPADIDSSHNLQVANPSGGEISTVGDMVAFGRALLNHKLLGVAMTDTVTTGKVSTGRPGPGNDRYAYGFGDVTIANTRIVGHNGGTPGYEGQLDIYPGTGTVVAVLTNVDGVLPDAIIGSEDLITGHKRERRRMPPPRSDGEPQVAPTTAPIAGSRAAQ